MKMYACKRIGRGYTIANSMEFRGVSYLEKDTTSIKVNKSVVEIFNMVGMDVSKENMIGGSMWVYNNNIPELKLQIESLKNVAKVTQVAIIQALTQFMGVCINKGYDIRLY